MTAPTTDLKKEALVRYTDETASISCPYGNVKRVVTGGLGGVANVHIVNVSLGSLHFHLGYDEVYYVLSGTGRITLSGVVHSLRPGAVVVIPAEVPHELVADEGQSLEFIIFGTPAMAFSDERAKPRKT